VVGTPFYIMEYCDGRVLWDPLLPELPKEARLAIHRAKFETLVRLHAVDYVALGLADFGRPGSYVARQISRWGKQYKASETEKIDSMDRLLDWLPAHLPANDETVLVHGDYRLDNMVFHPTEPRVLGIIDWEISTLGDPLAELSYLCMLWRTPKDWGGLKGHDLAALGLPTEQEMVAYYCELAKRPLPDPALWEFYMAYNLFRVSCIRQGVYARALDGTASNMRAAESGKLVRPAADLAWQIVDGMAGGAR
jgi:aminoglycoside phosphotransferase (APT) family kinase protein